MNNIIFIFTNEYSIRTHLRVHRSKHSIDLEQNPISRYKGIYLLKDSYELGDIEQFKEEVWDELMSDNLLTSNKNAHFIYHSKPDKDSIIRFIEDKGFKTHFGCHQQVMPKYEYYAPLYHLLQGEISEELALQEWNKLFASEGDLETALKLLHDIYSGKIKNEFETEENKTIRENSDIVGAYNTLVGNTDDWEYDDSIHQEKLIALRDKILLLSIAN